MNHDNESEDLKIYSRLYKNPVKEAEKNFQNQGPDCFNYRGYSGLASIVFSICWRTGALLLWLKDQFKHDLSYYSESRMRCGNSGIVGLVFWLILVGLAAYFK